MTLSFAHLIQSAFKLDSDQEMVMQQKRLCACKVDASGADMSVLLVFPQTNS